MVVFMPKKNRRKAMLVSMGMFPFCLHMEMWLRCCIRQGKIFPIPTTYHCWSWSSAAVFARCNAEMWLENMGRRLFPVFVLRILVWASLPGSKCVCTCVCSAVGQPPGPCGKEGSVSTRGCHPAVPRIASPSSFSGSSQALSLFTGVRHKNPHMNI